MISANNMPAPNFDIDAYKRGAFLVVVAEGMIMAH